MSNKHGYVHSIDGLRAVAVISVIIFHIKDSYLPGGFNGVDMFFAISGYVVTKSVYNVKISKFIDFISFFYARRLLRIAPALVAMLLTTFVLSSMFVPQSWIGRNTVNTGFAAFFGLSNFVLYLNSDSYFSASTHLNYFTHTWSLGVEEQFYLIFPVIIFWANKISGNSALTRYFLYVLSFLSISSLIICGITNLRDHQHSFYMIDSRFWELGFGMLLCLAAVKLSP